ncbi:hypothetical protein K7711_02675 [Nocardia sp. CA2R105]|uniref:hypothetical protein n=1 Tax=Nocardia coffeae TaxID=2873381 RepID=UPI001CA6D909|nr:hypothetical protein [Nocardia coffeae]MBY8855371.1 hypothetical protein [Nocardia coffeae]
MPDARPANDTNDAAVRAALAANPGATASALAFDAGMSVSTARTILGRMADDGTAVRTTDPDAARATYLWTLADTAPPARTATAKPAARSARTPGRPKKTGTPAPPAPAKAKGRAATGAGSTASAGGVADTVDKLPPGGLRGLVEDHLRDNPGESFSPTALKHALDTAHAPRQFSSGAINNALEKLTAEDVATRTSDAPKKWALAAGA